MRLRQARIAPVLENELTKDQDSALAGFDRNRALPNILTTLARTPDALKSFGVWARHLLTQRVLPPRQREIVILRVGYLCRSGYEFAQHTRIGMAAGLSAEEVVRIKQGAAAGWNSAEAALIRACDDIVSSHFITEDVWRALASEFTQEQIAYVVYVASQYVQVSIILNTFGVQVESTLKLDPDLASFAD